MASKKSAPSNPGGRGHLGREVIVQTALNLEEGLLLLGYKLARV